MLQQMREWFRYLKWVLLIIVLMFVWWAFDPTGRSAPRREQSWAARVNGAEISIAAFQSQARRLDSTYQSILGPQYQQQRAFLRVGRQAIDGLVEAELLYQEARRQGVVASSEEVAQAITREPGLQENGQFIGLDRYRGIFGGNRAQIEDYESRVRRELVIGKFRSLIQDGVSVSDSEVFEEFALRNEKASVEYLVLEAAKVVPAKPGEAEIARYYEEHRDRYAMGEGRTGRYVLFDAAAFAAGVEVSEPEIEAAYNQARATRFSQPEQRRASHILFKTPENATAGEVAKIEAAARKVLAQARTAPDFGALAKKHSQDTSASNGGDLGFFGRGQMVKEFEDAAFGLPVGSVSDLVRTSFGFHIIKVTDAREPREIPLEEARQPLRDEIQRTQAREALAARSADLAHAAAGGQLEEAARSRGLELRDTGPVRSGEPLAGVPASQAAGAALLALAPGEVSEPVAVPGGMIVLQATGTLAPEPKPLDQVRVQVQKDVQEERARLAVASSLASAAGSKDPLQTVARKFGGEVKTQADVTRGMSLPGLGPSTDLERQIFSLPPDRNGEPVVTSSGIAVVRVKDRTDPHAEFESQKESVRETLVRQRQDRFYRAMLRRLREQGDVEVNEPMVRSVDQT